MAEHVGRSYRTKRMLGTPPQSSIREHAFLCDSRIDISIFKIVSTASNVLDLRILESLHISKNQPILNDTRSSFPLKIIKQ